MEEYGADVVGVDVKGVDDGFILVGVSLRYG